MEWDRFKMAQKFLQRANAIYPEDADNSIRQVDALALQDFYYDCYMSSFSREDLLKRLAEIVSGKIALPEEEVADEDRYRSTYLKQAQSILNAIQRGDTNW
jgi:hypothetical protein